MPVFAETAICSLLFSQLLVAVHTTDRHLRESQRRPVEVLVLRVANELADGELERFQLRPVAFRPLPNEELKLVQTFHRHRGILDQLEILCSQPVQDALCVCKLLLHPEAWFLLFLFLDNKKLRLHDNPCKVL